MGSLFPVTPISPPFPKGLWRLRINCGILSLSSTRWPTWWWRRIRIRWVVCEGKTFRDDNICGESQRLSFALQNTLHSAKSVGVLYGIGHEQFHLVVLVDRVVEFHVLLSKVVSVSYFWCWMIMLYRQLTSLRIQLLLEINDYKIYRVCGFCQ